MEGQKPVKEFKAGGVRAAVWENVVVQNGKEVVIPSVRIDRTYKDGVQFKRTSAFGTRDLARVQLVAAKAFEFLELRERGEAA